MTTNNQYYKQIAETLGGSEISGNHSDNYYLHLIAVHYCGDIYTQTECNGKYLKDIAEQVCDTTYTEIRFNNFYLHQWAEHLVGEELPNNSDNYFLHLIKENLGTAITIHVDDTEITYGESITITGNLSFRSTGIASAAVKLYNGETLITDDITTDSDGDYTYTYANASVGTLALRMVYEGSGSYGEATSNTISVIVNKITSTITVASSANSVRVGTAHTISGVLSVGSEKQVVIYQNGVALETVTTTTDGAFTSQSITHQVSGTNTYYAAYAGDETHSAVTSSTISVEVLDLIPTTLTIEVPALIYSDEFRVTGLLVDENNTPLANTNVNMIWNDGSEHTETSRTNSNGEVTFVRSAPTSITDYTFQLQYVSDGTYAAATTSVVTRSVGKETSILSCEPPSTVYADSFNVNGGLYTNDTETISDKTIVVSKIVDGVETVLTELTSNSIGVFYGTISGLTAGNNLLRFAFEGDDYYTAVHNDVTINYVTYDGVIISEANNKSVLSYADQDTASFSAQLTNNGSAVNISGVSVSFDIVDSNDTVVSHIGDGTTDSSGVAVCDTNYASTGAGDILVQAITSSVSSSTYNVEDCEDYQPMIDNSAESRWTIPSAVSSSSIFGYSSDGWKFGNVSSYSRIIHNTSQTAPFSAEFTITEMGNASYSAPIVYFYTNGNTTPNTGFDFGPNNIDYNATTVVNRRAVLGAVYRIEFLSSTVKLYENDVLLYTGSHSVTLPTNFEFHTGSSRYCRVKDFKIKPLE